MEGLWVRVEPLRESRLCLRNWWCFSLAYQGQDTFRFTLGKARAKSGWVSAQPTSDWWPNPHISLFLLLSTHLALFYLSLALHSYLLLIHYSSPTAQSLWWFLFLFLFAELPSFPVPAWSRAHRLWGMSNGYTGGGIWRTRGRPQLSRRRSKENSSEFLASSTQI